ncbi:MAG: family 1 encapsulin nanocompartment shell protein [Bacteroidales bacterium]|jgi:uncharacterized linocin/CFP29 family protein|nr:family 1 encapsulin nanocompartment shell protein [Bacteroidales bacterium]
MDILRKSLAPISQQAWEEINDTAVDVLTAALSARKFVDVEGPKGLDYAALSTGRIQVPANQKDAVKYGIYQVLPLVEARIPFELNVWELDNVARGADDIDLGPMEEAALKIAQFEEKAIYEGFKPANIGGLKNNSDHDALTFPETAEEVMGVISEGVAKFKANGIEGPYTLVLNSKKWQMVNSFMRGYPLRKQIENLLGGSIILAPYIKDAYLVTERGGDFKMVIGQDLSIGYESHNNKNVQLYFSESFTFQVIDPVAIIVLK